MAILPGTRIRDNGVFGTTTNNPLAIGGTTLNSAGLSTLGVVSSNHALITLDPLRQFGAPEIVMVTAHTAAATSATIQRGMFGTVARAHPLGTLWVHAAADNDFIEVLTSVTRPSDQYEGQFIFETDTNKLVGFGGVDWAPRDAGGTIGYAQITADQGSITAEVDVTGLSVPVVVGTGRRILISAQVIVLCTAADNVLRIQIKEGGTVLTLAQTIPPVGASGMTLQAAVSLTPSAGAHTYKISAVRASGAGTMTVQAAATFPAFILVEDIGAA